MMCNKCGAHIDEGEKFCSVCGTETENGAEPKQPGEKKPYGESSIDQYDPPARKNSRKFLWIGIGAVAALALAAVLIFVVFAGGEGWPLSGNTTQTKFVNDNVGIFADAFSGMDNGTFGKLLNDPFDLHLELANEVSGQKFTAVIDAAYDRQTLGFNAQSNGDSNKLLLLGSTLYTESSGNVSGIRFETDEDMGKTMTLTERLEALVKGLSQGNAKAPDLKKLAETLVNSIDEKCFEKSADKTTLTLDIDDVINIFKNFSKKLQADKELSADVNDYIKQISGTALDVPDTLNMLASLLESAKDSIQFTLVWEISYKNGAPASLDISLDDGSGSINDISFGYDRDGADTNITFAYNSPDGNSDIDGELNYTKTETGIEYGGSLNAGGQTFSLSGSENWQGDTAHGEITLNIPDSGESRITYDETLKFGMPAKNVQDDERFKMDTSQAVVTDAASMLNLLGTGADLAGFAAQPAFSVIQEEKLVGITLPAKRLARWSSESSMLKYGLEDEGYHVDLQYSDNAADVQSSQIENQIKMGCDVLVIAPVDPDGLGNVLEKAKEAGIIVVALNQLIMDTDKCDYFVTFSRYDIGRMQGEYIVSKLGLDKGAAVPFTLECFAGSPDDSNAYTLYQGAMEVLQPYIDSGTLIVKSGQTLMSDTAIQNWQSAKAQERMDNLLAEYYADGNVDAILSANDSIAQGIVAALKDAGYGTDGKPYPILTGQDCDKINIGQIIRSEQSMSVLTDSRILEYKVVKIVEAILSGKAVPVDSEHYNGVFMVPSYDCELKYADAGNYKELLIDSGLIMEGEIPKE